MSLVNTGYCCFVQVHPTDSQYREYKRCGDSFWSKLESVKLDTAKLEHLFESKSKEIPVTKVNQCLVRAYRFGSSQLLGPVESYTICT